MINEKPILMDAESIVGLQLEVKNQTRRTRGLEKVNECPDQWELQRIFCEEAVPNISGDILAPFAVFKNVKTGHLVSCTFPYGHIHEHLWVKETFISSIHSDGYNSDGSENVHECPGYRADLKYRCGKPVWGERFKWTSSLFMPRKFSRFTLEIERLWVERVCDITASDACLEGIIATTFWPLESRSMPNDGKWYDEDDFWKNYPQKIFMKRWNSINAKRGLSSEKNPWVWPIMFKEIK